MKENVHKLQKQVDILEAHPEYMAATHSLEMVDENGEKITDPQVLSVGDLYDWKGIYTYDDFATAADGPAIMPLLSAVTYIKKKNMITRYCTGQVILRMMR